MNPILLELKNLHFSYQKDSVLEDISLQLRKGEFLGIVGPNGSGKSTLMKLILGLLKPDQGQVELFGQPVYRVKERRKIGYVSQRANHFNLDFPATVKEVVASGLYGKIGLFRRMKRDHWHRVDQVLEQVGLQSFADRSIGKLSGGQQQRALIARALVSDPELLILDEPTVGIDARSTEEFYQLLQQLHQQAKLSLILVSHDIGVISTYVDQIACLNRRLFFHGGSVDFAKRQQEILSEAYGHQIQVIEHQHE